MALLDKSKANKLVPRSSFQPGNLPAVMSPHVSPAISKLNFSDTFSAEYFLLPVLLSHLTWWASSSTVPPAAVVCGTGLLFGYEHFSFSKLLYEFRPLLGGHLHGFHFSAHLLTAGPSYLPKIACAVCYQLTLQPHYLTNGGSSLLICVVERCHVPLLRWLVQGARSHKA